MTTMHARIKSARGAELIEFALVFPLLLLVVLGIVDFGFLFQRMEVVTNAAREGARIAVLPGYTASDACTRALSYLVAGGVKPDSNTCTCPSTGGVCTSPTNPTITVNTSAQGFSIDLGGGTTLSGKQVIVQYTSPYLFLTPLMSFFGGSMSSVPVRGVAVMRDEIPSS